jgi:hypothetical protein
VATLLETLRALTAGPSLRNDVIGLFTDGEEIGLLGAKAFLEHPWAADVGLVMNFEARGTSGPSIMFETSDLNERLIREFAKAAPNAVANSLSYEIYKRLPNDTDLSVMKGAGLTGLNFAYIGNVVNYHTLGDSLGNLNPGSLQHHGSYALVLARHFANYSNLDFKAEQDAVYFDIVGLKLVNYSSSWATPLAGGVLLCFGLLVVYGFRSGRLTLKELLLGLVALPLSTAVSGVAVWVTWNTIRSLHSEYQEPTIGDTYNSCLYMIAFTLMSFVVTSAVYNALSGKVRILNLAVGGMVWFAAVLIAANTYVKGASYLFTWPLLFTTIGAAVNMVWGGETTSSKSAAVTAAVCALPAVVLFAPIVYQIYTAVTLRMSWATAVMVAFSLGLVIPTFSFREAPWKWYPTTVVLLGVVALVIAGSITASFDKEHRRPTHLFYALDSESGRAVWASSQARVDDWTSQFFSQSLVRGTLHEFLPLDQNIFIRSNASPIPLTGPELTLLEDRTKDGIRKLRVRALSRRGAEVISLYVQNGTDVLGAEANGKRLVLQGTRGTEVPAGTWGIDYYGASAAGLEELRAQLPIALVVIDRSNGLPAMIGQEFKPRPDHMMPSPEAYSDQILVRRSYTY